MTAFDHELAAASPPLAPVAGMPAAARWLLALLRRLDHGMLHVRLPDGTLHRFGRTSDGPPAVLAIHAWRVAADTLKGGDIGFAEGYLRGDWDSPDLVRLLGVLAMNQQALERAFFAGGLTAWLLRLKHLRNANTKRQAKRNIAAHYDLGNAFYRLWLDRSMTYSAALFEGDQARPLEDAQRAKYERILRQVALPPGAHILEIGCGWGGFAEIAARAGYRVTGLSLSDAQTAYARERIARAGLAERVELRVQDYRDERGVYDGVVSIEMVEAVGERWWPAYFERVRAALRPGGRACLQSITIDEAKFDRYRRGTDFIQQFVFPGGMLPSPSRLLGEARRAGLHAEAPLMFGADYARTLRLWLDAFEANVAAVRGQGFDEHFVRCWRFYLAYCIAGFTTGSTDVGHFTFVRP
ncbi:MAG TPA: cyclopropane-fatty-acyl-phospholipid synthase family protein [Casimicrobiaceae bacterium]|nr:cyclopropane-fatty-acyl-phospholipid synthase family protein [Casimicrobiaceae bacterium]